MDGAATRLCREPQMVTLACSVDEEAPLSSKTVHYMEGSDNPSSTQCTHTQLGALVDATSSTEQKHKARSGSTGSAGTDLAVQGQQAQI